MWPRKRIIVICSVLSASCTFGVAALLAGDSFNMSLFTLLLALECVFSSFAGASVGPALPQLVSAEELPRAEGLLQTRMQTAALLGPVFGGVLLDVASWLPFVANGVGDVLGICLFLMLRTNLNPATKAERNVFLPRWRGFPL
ncbi:MAG: MFS transporter [Corynebacterium sp.]|nr:MFS transporter [Corynebacterium sp.]